MKKKIVKLAVLTFALTLMLALFGFASEAAGDNLQTVKYYVTYGQPEARSMLDMINEFRTGDEAWYWNSDNKTKTYCKDLKPLVYDYELERIAKQRAAEIAISFSHTRPNGELCFSLYPDNYYYYGENIAAGYSSTEAVMDGWKETDLLYEGQGHRRNMLEENYNAVGIARVYFGGTYYWVQEFGYTTDTTEKTEASILSEKVEVDVDFSGAKYSVSLTPDTMKLKCGAFQAWPQVKIRFQLPNAWPSVYTDADVITDFEIEDESLIFTRDAGICAMGEGNTKLIANVVGKSYAVDVRCDHSYYDTYVVYETCTTPGSVIVACPCGAKYEKSPPPRGHSYSRSLVKATFASDGYAKTVCKRCGDVSKEEFFKSLSSAELTKTKYTYDGKAKKPSVAVKDKDGKSLVEGTDYTVKYASGRKNPGKYAVKITFKGNYEGEKTLYFTILPGKTSTITATQNTSAIKLTWKKVTGATGYRVYQYNSKTGKYEKIKTTTGTSYTVKSLKAGTSYKFAVKAYTKTGEEVFWSASYVTLTTATKPATPTVKVTAGSKKATLTWSKVTGATGYQVYMQAPGEGYKKIKVTADSKYTVNSLKKGVTYKFRVRAYKKVYGKYIYSGYNTYSVKVK